MRALRAAWYLTSFAMRLVGTVLFVLHGMLLLQGNASNGVATGILCRAISIVLVVASKQDVNWFDTAATELGLLTRLSLSAGG